MATVSDNLIPDHEIPTSITMSGHLKLLATKANSKGPVKFELVAYTGTALRLSGFFAPVVIDLNATTFDPAPTPVIADHRPDLRIGHLTERSISKGKGGRITAKGI